MTNLFNSNPLDQVVEAFKKQIDSRSPENSCMQWYKDAVRTLAHSLSSFTSSLPPQQQELVNAIQTNLMTFIQSKHDTEHAAQPWSTLNQSVRELISKHGGANARSAIISVNKVIKCAEMQNPYLAPKKQPDSTFIGKPKASISSALRMKNAELEEKPLGSKPSKPSSLH